uniref:echinoderm microtubule-associated protein-like 6 n=1 Tax=Styela clava TaxID=7725 RepID=UPI00193A81B2|nr:echinoderm microtubule-associated protein-like 6 [Styela clava]
MADKTAPDTQLRLDWVYGYRGHQCRSNLFYTKANEVVYFVAGVGIVVDPSRRKQKFFLGHDDDIISLSLHPSGQLVATGQVGKTPYICVWESSTVKTMSILKDQHTHGIAALAFSPNGERLVSVGLDTNNLVVVWDWKKGRMLSNARGHTDRIFDVQWIDQAQFVTCGVKHIKFWNLSGNSLTNKRGVLGKLGEVQTALCVRCSADNVYSGMLSGDIYVWQGHNLTRIVSHAHIGGIFSMHSSVDGYATGGKDGNVRLWDAAFNPLATISLADCALGYKGLSIRAICWQGTHIVAGTHDGEVFEVSVRDSSHPDLITSGHGEGEMWGLAVHSNKLIVATGSDDKSVRLWSVPDRALLARCNLSSAVRSCAFGSEYLAVGCINGSVTVLKSRDMSVVTEFKDRKEAIHEVRFSPKGSYLAVASNDNFVDVYSVQQRYHRIGTCGKSSSFITHIDWSTDEQYLQTNDGAGERLVYSMPSGTHVTSGDVVRAVKWDTWTCVLGPEVAGIWPKYSQINDVNAACADAKLGVIATGDDAGLVKLLRYPCLKKGGKFRKYVGHSSHVTNVRFTHDSEWLLSAGGADHALFQWKVIKAGDVVDSLNAQIMDVPDAYLDSNSEDSDSSLSDVGEIDSEVEKEREGKYDNTVDKNEIKKLQRLPKGSRKRDGAPSDTSLSLQFVFGYRGYDCRDNVFYTQQGEILYHVAALGIVMSREDRKQRFYSGHDDDIICLTVHPAKDYVATGQVGKNPSIHIWDAETTKPISILKGFHTHGIGCVNFSGDGKRLVSVGIDNDHMLAIWDWRRGEKLASAKGHQDKVFCVKFDAANCENLITVGIKHIKFWRHVGGGLTNKRGIFGTNGKLESMLCVSQGKQVGVTYTGAANGQVYVWNGNNLTRTQKAHDGPCFAMHALDKGFVTGGKDGVVSLWDETFDRCLKSYSLSNQALSTTIYGKMLEDNPCIRALTLGHGKILVGTKNGEILEVDKTGPILLLTQGHGEGELWGLASHPSRGELVTVSDDRSVRTWNVGPNEMQTYVHACLMIRKLPVGGRCCCYSPDGSAVAVGCNDGSFYVLNSRTLEDMVKFHTRKEAISDVRFSPGTGKYLAVASHDNFVDIYSVLGSKRVGVCQGASSYITHIDWDISGKLLRVNTGAKELLYFEAPRGRRQTIGEEANIEWSSWTGVLGKKCAGIWPPCSDVTDVNAACLSKSGELATADDFGFVKLFSFPALNKHAKFKKYTGHSAHVTNVRWLFDDNHLASIGGADTSLLLWRRNNIAISTRQETAVGVSLSQASASQPDVSYHGDSEGSDTDSEEEGGYDSDVAHEKNMDYEDKIYKTRDMQGIQGSLEGDTKSQPVVNRAMKQSYKVRPRSGLAIDKVKSLSLWHVFGYRGFDCRDNLRYVNEGIVYHAAGACIFQDLSTGEQSFYLEHTDDIISLTTNQHPKFSGVIATGQLGASAPIHVWDVGTKQNFGVLQGPHQRGVCSLDFSASGKLLLSVGLEPEHFAAIWRWQEGVIMCKVSCSPHRIFRAQFRPDSDANFVSVGVKHVRFWQVCGGTAIGQRAVLGATKGIRMQTMLCIAFGADNLTFTGAMSGDIYVWKSHVLHRTVSQAHEGPVFTMFTTLQDGLIITGGKDKNQKESSSVKLWDQEMRRCRAFVIPASCIKSVCRAKGKLVVGTKDSQIFEVAEKSGSCSGLVRGHAEGLLSGVASHPTSHMCCTVSKDKTARVWDLNEKLLLHRLPLPAGGTCCCYSSSGRLMGVGMDNGQVQIYDVALAKLCDSRRDRGGSINDMKFSPDDKILAVASDDQCVDFYEVKDSSPQRSGYIRNTTALQLDFSSDNSAIQITTAKYERHVFKVPTGAEITDPSIINDLTWDSWTSIVGKEVVGIWPRDSQSADINCAHVSHAGNALVTGDDSGFVKLFAFPCQEKFATPKKYTGHSAHVTGARFLCDDKHLVTTGGDDCCVFVWKCGV